METIRKTKHQITLSNGKKLLVIEEDHGLTIADADELLEPCSFILHANSSGVLVYPNSGFALTDLCDGIVS